MRIELFIDKSLEQNAAAYFEKAKKAKAKVQGAQAAVAETKKKMHSLQSQASEVQHASKVRSKKWFEKFRWFVSSDGFMVIGGRDATTNEIVIKKHTEPHDVVFHTQMQGSPFFVIKTEGKKVPQQTLQEAADATASFSRAWKLGYTHAEVFHVAPEQVSKTAKPGEFVPKGGFMIYGKINTMVGNVKLAIGEKDGMVVCGPVSAVEKSAASVLRLKQANVKASDTAKKIRKTIKADLDELIRALPSGGCAIDG